MNCPNCGAEQNNSNSVCELCGYEFGEVTVPLQDNTPTSHPDQVAKSTSEQKQEGSKSLITIIVILIIALLGMGGILIYLFLNPNDASNKSADTMSVTENMLEIAAPSIEMYTETNSAITETIVTESTVLETTVSGEIATTVIIETDALIVESTIFIEEPKPETETELVAVKPTESITEVRTTSYAEAYLPLIQQAFMVDEYAKYCIYDLNADGINEIIIGTNLGGAMGLHQFFTLKDGMATHCGEISGSGYLLEESGNLYYETARMGYQEINQVQTFGNGIYMTLYFASDEMMTEYLDFGTDLTYYYTTDIDPVYALDS